ITKMSVNFSEISYKNFGKCIKMENETATVIVTVDVGPRVIYYGLNGKSNIFREDINRDSFNDKKQLHDFFETEENWYIYGGHRLWSSPESYPESYTPDNHPVPYEIKGNSIKLCPEDRVKVGERHTMTVTMDENTSKVTVNHTIQNIADFEIKLAPWCLTVAEKGGVEIVPQCTEDTGLLSNRRAVFWAYSDVRDPRFFICDKYITLAQTDREQAFKIGVNNEDGWGAYLNGGQLFIKRFDFDKDGEYPDYSVNYETYTNQFIMEIESLGTLETLRPGEFTEYNEYWEVKECSDTFDRTDPDSIDAFVKKHIL
ncbi:MAG: hypothetical protein K2N36_02610, partial [Ruminiclostridium sp.]|nr:hypothetical protein [Ruminiclostridium sp.]